MNTIVKLFNKRDRSSDARIVRKFLEPAACIVVGAFILSSALPCLNMIVAF